MQQLLEAFTVFSSIDHVRTGADDRHAIGFQRTGQFQRSLTAILHDHAERLFNGNDFQHVFQGQRLEVQTIGSVIVGRHGFRIAVDHDGFITIFTQRQRSVDATVVKLDTLTDTVRATTQHHDLFLVGRCGFAFLVIAGIHVSGVGSEFSRAGIHALVNRTHASSVASTAHGVLVSPQQRTDAAI